MAEQSPTGPAKRMQDVLARCDPGEPLPPGDDRYEDFAALRQGEGIPLLQKRLLAPGTKGFIHACFGGHRGCGKSTELLKLKQWADSNGFLAVRAETDLSFGLIQLEFSDIFLLAATQVEEAMKALGRPLPGNVT